MLVDRRNYHLFTPLLYQVASCLLSPGEIAAPLRKVFRGARNVRFRMGDVVRHRLRRRRSCTSPTAPRCRTTIVVLAAGSRTNFFGNDELARHALGLKDLGEALQLRNHVLDCLERATATDRRRRTAPPAHVLHRRRRSDRRRVRGRRSRELVRLVLPHEYPELARPTVRIVLLEGGDRLLPMFKPRLSGYARRELERRGVDVRTNALVADADDKLVRTQGRRARSRPRR